MLASTGQFDCLIALGVVLAGETSHHEVISYGTAYSLHSIGMQSEIPVINGILTVGSLERRRWQNGSPLRCGTGGGICLARPCNMAWHNALVFRGPGSTCSNPKRTRPARKRATRMTASIRSRPLKTTKLKILMTTDPVMTFWQWPPGSPHCGVKPAAGATAARPPCNSSICGMRIRGWT